MSRTLDLINNEEYTAEELLKVALVKKFIEEVYNLTRGVKVNPEKALEVIETSINFNDARDNLSGLVKVLVDEFVFDINAYLEDMISDPYVEY